MTDTERRSARVSSPSLGLLHERDFRNFFVSTAASALGNQVSILAFPLVAVVTLESDPFEVGVLTAMSMVANLIVGLPAGAWVDRMRCRNVVVFSNLSRAVIVLSVPIAWWTGALTIWQLYLTAFLVGICNVFGQVASQSYLPHLVGRENLVESNSKLGGIEQVSRLGGPGFAGQVIALLTAPVSLLVTSIALATSALLLFLIERPEAKPARKSGSGVRREIGEGLRFVFGDRFLRATAASISWTNLWGLAYSSMMIIYMARVLGLSPGVIGAVLSISGVGGLLGAFIARRIATWLGVGPTMWVSLLVGMPFLFVLPVVGPGWRIWLAAGAYAVAVCGMVVLNVIHRAARQKMTPDSLLGRMNATVRFLTWSTMPIGAMTGGALGSWLGPRATLVIAAACMCLGFLPIFLTPLRSMRDVPAAGATDPTDVDLSDEIVRADPQPGNTEMNLEGQATQSLSSKAKTVQGP